MCVCHISIKVYLLTCLVKGFQQNAVVDVNSVEVFKSRPDNFWKFQDVKFDYTADLTGTGDRSKFDT